MLSWDALLAAPAPRDHLVQLYTSEHALASTVTRFVERGLADGDGVIAIITAAHWTDVAPRLSAPAVDVTAAQASGQLVVLDAHDTLMKLMVDGMPDRALMRAVVVPAIDAARAAGHANVRAFGEMVDILNRRGNLAAAICLEELWNELLEAEGIALLCAYAIDPFDPEEYEAVLPSIGHVHSHLMPVEDPERLETAIDRAFVEVFGLDGDTRLLRELFLRNVSDETTMPAAQGALFAIRDVDTRLANFVLERAATHYRSA
jgi:DcmR-like sensory protein